MHRAGSHSIHISNPLQKQCSPAHCINITKIGLYPSFPVLLCPSTSLSLLCTALTARSFSCPCLELGSYKGLPQINKTQFNLHSISVIYRIARSCLKCGIMFGNSKQAVNYFLCLSLFFLWIEPLSQPADSELQRNKRPGWTALGVEQSSDKEKEQI